jgi:cytochrome c553
MVSITGRSASELSATLEAFRSGARPATLMNRLVKGFSPAEVQAIALWLAEQKT